MVTFEPTVAEANRRLINELSSFGGTNMTIIETKIHKFFPCYTERDLNNGMLYEILEMQGKNGIWYTGQSVFLDTIPNMLQYNKMLVNKLKVVA